MNNKSIELPVRFFRFFPGDYPHGETSKIEYLDPDHTVLLLIDVYHAAEKPQARELVHSRWDQEFWITIESCLVPVINSAREVGLPIIYISNSSPRIEINKSTFGKRLNESLGFDPTVDFREPDVDPLEFDQGELVQLFIPPQIAPQSNDYFIRKHTYSGFFETRLDSLLRNLSAQNLICAGFAEDVCVLFTIADAVFRGYYPILVRDGTLAPELPDEITDFKQTKRMTTYIESFLGPSTTSKDFIAAIEKSLSK
jgi:nicotinamidase-related amidase